MATLIEDTLSIREDFELQHYYLVREEIETFRVKANAFLAGEIPEDEFRPFRLKHGIYGQRQPGVQMVRCKVPGGLLTAAQMEQLARISETFAGGKGHITTRQNMQYHFVPLAQVADVMHLLADVEMTNREACYNKMPNIIAVALGRVLPGGALSVAALLDPSRQAELLMTLAAMPPQQPITVPRSFANTDWTRGLAQPCDDKNSAPQAGAAAPVGLPPAPGTSRAAALDNVVLGNLPPMPRSSRAAIGRQPALPVIPLTAAAPPSARVSGVDTGIGASFKPMPAPDIGDPDSPVIVPLAPASACRA